MKIATGRLQFLSLRENTRVEARNVNEHVKPRENKATESLYFLLVKPNNETTRRLHFHFSAELLCGRRPRIGAPYSYQEACGFL